MKSILVVATLLLISSTAIGEELAVGAKAIPFELTNSADGQPVSFEPGNGKVSVIVFTCNECPYAKAFEERLASIGRSYGERGVSFYAVNPNDDTKYPGEKIDLMKQRAEQRKFPFPYLKDGDSSIARQYGARVTPHVFLVDGAGVVQYRGYVDNSAKSDERSHAGLTEALDAVLAKKPVAQAATKAFGCTIKWKRDA